MKGLRHVQEKVMGFNKGAPGTLAVRLVNFDFKLWARYHNVFDVHKFDDIHVDITINTKKVWMD